MGTELPNPTLELRNGNGALLRFNNDWQDDPAQAAEINAAGLAPTNNLESAIAATLPPGLYTALLAGLNNRTGIGVVEVYDRGNGIPNPTPTLPPFPSPTPPSPPTPYPVAGSHPLAHSICNRNPASGNADPDHTGKPRMYSELRWSDRASPAPRVVGVVGHLDDRS